MLYICVVASLCCAAHYMLFFRFSSQVGKNAESKFTHFIALPNKSAVQLPFPVLHTGRSLYEPECYLKGYIKQRSKPKFLSKIDCLDFAGTYTKFLKVMQLLTKC